MVLLYPTIHFRLPFLYNLCVANFKEECGWKPENLFLTSHIHPEGTLHVLLILKTYKQLTEHNLSTKYSIWNYLLVPKAHCSFHLCSFCAALSCQLMAFLTWVQHHSSFLYFSSKMSLLAVFFHCLLECAISFVFIYRKSVKRTWMHLIRARV